MAITEQIQWFKRELELSACKLIAVSKTQPVEAIKEAFLAGQYIFGENKAQEMASKHKELPHEIEWHMIGNLQRNKVKLIAPFVHTIQSVDSLKLLSEINKHAVAHNRIINCLVQIYIAEEETKHGMSLEEAKEMFQSDEFNSMTHIRVTGVMGISTNTSNEDKIRGEFRKLRYCFNDLRETFFFQNDDFKEISMGMSSDYKIALQEGSTMVRVGSAIFGEREKKH